MRLGAAITSAAFALAIADSAWAEDRFVVNQSSIGFKLGTTEFAHPSAPDFASMAKAVNGYKPRLLVAATGGADRELSGGRIGRVVAELMAAGVSPLQIETDPGPLDRAFSSAPLGDGVTVQYSVAVDADHPPPTGVPLPPPPPPTPSKLPEVHLDDH